jgi:hypothetical protein
MADEASVWGGTSPVPVCDGCGAYVDDQHIRQRIERLEFATRFRPIHIGVLLIDAAPPARSEDFFYSAYAPSRALEYHSTESAYFHELAKLASASGPDIERQTVLAEFQHRGFFHASAVECPVADGDDLRDAVRRLAQTVVRRVQTSYRPKYVALISEPTRELIEGLQNGGWGGRLILENGVPFGWPPAGDLRNPVVSPASLGDRLVAAISRLS